MKKPVVDYSSFRLSKIKDPQFSHLKYLLGWVVYFALYFITEKFIPPETCHVVHSPLDDLIPFCEFFVIPYVFWYFLIVISLVYFAACGILSGHCLCLAEGKGGIHPVEDLCSGQCDSYLFIHRLY